MTWSVDKNKMTAIAANGHVWQIRHTDNGHLLFVDDGRGFIRVCRTSVSLQAMRVAAGSLEAWRCNLDS